MGRSKKTSKFAVDYAAIERTEKRGQIVAILVTIFLFLMVTITPISKFEYKVDTDFYQTMESTGNVLKGYTRFKELTIFKDRTSGIYYQCTSEGRQIGSGWQIKKEIREFNPAQ